MSKRATKAPQPTFAEIARGMTDDHIDATINAIYEAATNVPDELAKKILSAVADDIAALITERFRRHK